MKPSARHRSRELALQALYEWLLTKNPVDLIEKHFLDDIGSEKVDCEYFAVLLRGGIENCSEIDQLIKPYISRPIEGISPVELSVLRLATFELAYQPSVPYRVVINEALELAKKFGASEGYRFINAVLDQISKQLRQDEMNESK